MTFAWLFPGQGSQTPGMGKDFYENYPLVRQTFEEGDDILKRNLSKIIFNGPESELTLTSNSQPAIFLLSFALSRLLRQEIHAIQPKYAAGLSLGEYTAYAAAGVLSFQEALKLVDRRSRAMAEACVSHPGTMAVVLGLEPEIVESAVKTVPNLWAANFNCPGQIVISGTKEAVDRGSELLKEKGAKRVLPLQVHGAFHSGLMKSAENKLKDAIDEADFQKSSLQVVSNVSARPTENLNEMKDLLIRQVTHPVRWQESIEWLEKEGVTRYLEIGYGKSLQGLNKRIGVKGPTFVLEKIEDLEPLAKEFI